MLRVRGFDHLVLLTPDVERSLAWYRDVLGLEAVREEEWRRGEVFFPSVRVSDTAILDILQSERTGRNIDHFCLVTDPVDLEGLVASGRFDIVEGPTDLRFGAQGFAHSLYVRDPDGNVVELRSYDA